jgi:hypothetical protein
MPPRWLPGRREGQGAAEAGQLSAGCWQVISFDDDLEECVLAPAFDFARGGWTPALA